MTQQAKWGPWIGHNGGECPVDDGAWVLLHYATSEQRPGYACGFNWGNPRIIAYRVKLEPVRETVTVHCNNYYNSYWAFGVDVDTSDTHKITFDTVGGEPECSSIKMVKL